MIISFIIPNTDFFVQSAFTMKAIAIDYNLLFRSGGPSMDQHYLEYILALAETGNMSRAAKKLYIAQPTLSLFLAKQEAAIGTPLFIRIEGVYTLTPTGELYAEYARKVLALTDTLEKDVKRLSTSIRIIIGNSASRSLQMLTVILTDFRKRYPKVELIMSDSNFSSMSGALSRNETDMAFVTAPPLNHYKGGYIELKKEEVLFAAPHSHPFCNHSECWQHPPLTAAELLTQFGTGSFILQPKGTCIRSLIDSFFELEKFNPMIAFSTTYAQSVFDMVISNMGVGFLPSGYALPSPQITYFSLEPKMDRIHYILYREDPALEAPCRYLIDLAQQYAEKNW